MADKVVVYITQQDVRITLVDKEQVQLLLTALESFGKLFHHEGSFQVIYVESEGVAEEENDSGNRHLLEELVKEPEQLQVIDKALDKGILRIAEDGRLRRGKGSKTLLAYFIGRLLAYDEVYEDKFSKELCWKLCARFPDKLVKLLFVDDGMRTLRKNRRDMPLPHGHEMIDELFD